MLRLGLMFMNMGIYEKEGGSVFTNRSERNPLCLDCWSKSIMNHHISLIWTFLGEEKGQGKSNTLDACVFFIKMMLEQFFHWHMMSYKKVLQCNT